MSDESLNNEKVFDSRYLRECVQAERAIEFALKEKTDGIELKEISDEAWVLFWSRVKSAELVNIFLPKSESYYRVCFRTGDFYDLANELKLRNSSFAKKLLFSVSIEISDSTVTCHFNPTDFNPCHFNPCHFSPTDFRPNEHSEQLAR